MCVWCAEQLQSCSQAKANWQARLKVVIIWAEQLSSERPSLEKKKMSTQLRNYYCEIIIAKLLFQLHQRDTEQSKDSNPSWTAASKQASFIVIITCFPFPAHRHSPPLRTEQLKNAHPNSGTQASNPHLEKKRKKKAAAGSG